MISNYLSEPSTTTTIYRHIKQNIHSPASRLYSKNQPELDNDIVFNQRYHIFKSISISIQRSRLYNWFEEIDDKVFDGSILGYADTTPFNITEPIGSIFLLTNVVYLWASFAIGQQGGNGNAIAASVIIDVAGLLSINYHWNQLVKGPNNNDVRVSLILDYFGAFLAIFLILEEILRQSITTQVIPVSAILLGIFGAINLILSWVFANGAQYIFFHSLWHLFSGISSYVLFTRSTS